MKQDNKIIENVLKDFIDRYKLDKPFYDKDGKYDENFTKKLQKLISLTKKQTLKLQYEDELKFLKSLIKNGWECENREGSHETYSKLIDGKMHFLQVIYNNKTMYESNAKHMIEKSDIPLNEWLKKCK